MSLIWFIHFNIFQHSSAVSPSFTITSSRVMLTWMMMACTMAMLSTTKSNNTPHQSHPCSYLWIIAILHPSDLIHFDLALLTGLLLQLHLLLGGVIQHNSGMHHPNQAPPGLPSSLLNERSYRFVLVSWNDFVKNVSSQIELTVVERMAH